MAAPKNPQSGPNPNKAPHRNRTHPDDPTSIKTVEKIRASHIVNKLIDHVVNGTEMQSTQVTAGLGLLKKVLPDLSAIDATTNGESFNKAPDQLSDDELNKIAANKSK